jgi:hypothetical protein
MSKSRIPSPVLPVSRRQARLAESASTAYAAAHSSTAVVSGVGMSTECQPAGATGGNDRGASPAQRSRFSNSRQPFATPAFASGAKGRASLGGGRFSLGRRELRSVSTNRREGAFTGDGVRLSLLPVLVVEHPEVLLGFVSAREPSVHLPSEIALMFAHQLSELNLARTAARDARVTIL